MPQREESAGQRDGYFDGIRALLALFVVAIHVSDSGRIYFEKGLLDPTSVYMIVLKQILLLAVPIFFMLSGYFSPAARGDLRPGRIGRRLARILVPYLVWCVVIAVWFHVPLLKALNRILTGRLAGPHYFVPILVFFIIAEPFLVRLFRSDRVLVATGMGMTLVHVLVSYVFHVLYPSVTWYRYMAVPTAWIGYYALGIYLYRHPPALGLWPVVALVALLASFGEAALQIQLLGLDSGAFEPVKLSTLVYATAMSVTIVAARPDGKTPIHALAWIGSVSYGIFLFHEPIRGRIAPLIQTHLTELTGYQPLFQLLAFVLTVGIILALAFLAQRILGRRLSARLLGF